jgi:hypothetical protein
MPICVFDGLPIPDQVLTAKYWQCRYFQCVRCRVADCKADEQFKFRFSDMVARRNSARASAWYIRSIESRVRVPSSRDSMRSLQKRISDLSNASFTPSDSRPVLRSSNIIVLSILYSLSELPVQNDCKTVRSLMERIVMNACKAFLPIPDKQLTEPVRLSENALDSNHKQN